MRKTHHIEEQQNSEQAHSVPPIPMAEAPAAPEPQLLISAWLQPLLEHITAYLGERITHDDLDLLSTSLYHLYSSIDKLYCTILPELASALAFNQEEKQHDYAVWVQLRHSKRMLERIEIVCHLLSGVLTSVLHALDTVDSTREKRERKRFSLSATLGARAVAFAQLQHQLEEWQRCFVEYQPLLLQHSEQILSSSKREIIDKGWGIVLLSAVAIFGDILPDIQGIGEGDDEATATLLLDLAQQTDQILLQTEAMLEPFPLLIKYSAYPQEM